MRHVLKIAAAGPIRNLMSWATAEPTLAAAPAVTRAARAAIFNTWRMLFPLLFQKLVRQTTRKDRGCSSGALRRWHGKTISVGWLM